MIARGNSQIKNRIPTPSNIWIKLLSCFSLLSFDDWKIKINEAKNYYGILLKHFATFFATIYTIVCIGMMKPINNSFSGNKLTSGWKDSAVFSSFFEIQNLPDLADLPNQLWWVGRLKITYFVEQCLFKSIKYANWWKNHSLKYVIY